MFRHVVEARKILTAHHFDKLMYEKKAGETPPTVAELVTKYKLVELFKDFPKVDQDLLNKIAALKQYIQTTQDTYNRTLLTTCEVLEDKYRSSIQGTHTLLVSLYDTTTKSNTKHKCPYRWYGFVDSVPPLIRTEKASQTLAELNRVYEKNIQLNFTDDKTNNAYDLLDYIKLVPLPAPQCSSIYDLLRVIKVFLTMSQLRSTVGYTTNDKANIADTRRLVVETFNSLCPKDAYIFSKRVPLYVRQDSAGQYLPDVPNNRPVDLNTFWEPLISKKTGAVLSGTDLYGTHISLDMNAFDAKVAQYGRQRGSSRRKTRKLRS